MKGMRFNHGIRGIHRILMLAVLGMVWVANAAIGTSEGNRLDLSGMGSREMRTAQKRDLALLPREAKNAII